MNKHDSSFAKKTDFLSRYLVLSEIRCARKKSNQKQEQNLLSKVFNLFEIFEITEQEFLLDSLLSAWTFVYWNMNTRWKYFLNYYHRILFLEIQMTTVQKGSQEHEGAPIYWSQTPIYWSPKILFSIFWKGMKRKSYDKTRFLCVTWGSIKWTGNLWFNVIHVRK